MLPAPTTSRFQPLRSGLINLFKYQDQEFWFEKGRLLIRGNNGTGKSRVLALQLPFLLDGEISSRRVEPDGDPARQIAWHLLMDEHEQRTGYTWLELGRRDEAGGEHFVTLGCGMRAIKGGDNQPTRWFFITERRVGGDFTLMDGAHPLSADRLVEVLGEGCIFKKPADYRAAIDRRLFALGENRYAALIELLIRLRAPQLAKKLDERTLFAALSDALPPLAPEVVGPVAAAFKQLDELRDQFESLQSLFVALATFQSGYQTYLQVALLRRAEQVRSKHSKYEDAQRKVLEIERETEAAKAVAAEAAKTVEDATDDFTASDAHYETLKDSSAAGDARQLDEAQRAAADEAKRSVEAKQRADEAGTRFAEAEAEHDQQSAEHDEHLAARDSATREAAKLASPAGVAREFSALLPSDSAWQPDLARFEKLKSEHGDLARNHLHRLDQIDAGLAEVATAKGKLESALNNENQLAEKVAEHRDDVRQHDDDACQALDALAAAYADWRRQLRWLAGPPWSELASTFAEWLEAGDGSRSVLAPVLERASGEERSAIAIARADLKVQISHVADERRLLLEERENLATAPPAPAPPATRNQASRAGRDGAPLWQLCEFHSSLTPAQRTGLEAALEASGLLDAWLAPDGTLSGDLPSDTFFETAETKPADGPTLAEWLIADDGDEPLVEREMLRRVLARVGAGPSSSRHWVALDGRWQLGPVFGRGEKAQAQHLGATSREAARRRRLAEIAAALDGLAFRDEQLKTEAGNLDVRAAETDGERNRAPMDREIASYLTLRTNAQTQFNAASLAHANAVRETHRARGSAQAWEEKLRKDARDLGYGAHLENLPALRAMWPAYELAITRLWSEARAWLSSAIQIEKLDSRRRICAEKKECEAGLARAAHSTALRAAEIFRTLQQSLGASVAEFQRSLQAARGAKEAAQQALNEASAKVSKAEKLLANLDGARVPSQEKVREADGLRDDAIKALRVPLIYDLFPEAHPGLADIEKDEWSPTRAYAIARRLDKDLPTADLNDDAWTIRLNALNAQINDLRTRTGAACEIESQVLSEGLTIVVCRYQGARLRPAACLAAVGSERETHERLLDAREREIIDRHLINEVSLQLQTLIENARQRTNDMNEEMTRCATTLGVTLRLAWAPISEALPPGLPAVLKLLLADHALWSPEERTTVGNFLHEIIQTEQTTNPTATTADQLLSALDYRKWHAFFAERYQNNRWERLTKKRFGTGSVGEKALMLTIPQMAAAASHYRSAAPHAPRFILLDEAFSGIDKPTRARCMGLLESFDLDLVMTSEREWGAHATISGIAIYQLVADAEAVAATRWVWNGSKTVLAPVPDTPELRVQS